MSLVSPPPAAQRQDAPQGIAAALSAFAMWGFLPLYWKLLGALPAHEQMCHRMVWSAVTFVPVIILTGRTHMLLDVLRQRKLLAGLVCSTLCISINWYLYIWTIGQGRVLDASLGYYINPLMSAVLGGVLLKERFSRLQGIGIALAAVGVLWNIVGHGGLPVLALALALTFSLYGLAHKIVPVDPICGVCVETLLMAPFALVVLSFGYKEGGGAPAALLPVLMLAGPITLLPMLCFGFAAQRIRLTILGLTQYVSPTISFFLGILVFREAFDLRSLVTFGCIWAGLAVFSWASWRLAHPPQRRASRGMS